jgi:transient-receptor-potential-like protein
MHRQAEENPVTEDDINEVKGEISAAKCELLEVLRSNGLDISTADTKEKSKHLHIFPFIVFVSVAGYGSF